MITTQDILHARILIVDDLPANVTLLEQMLRGAGYTAIASTLDPTKVCELHLLHHYDLILLDLKMPVMDGFQVMENLKEIEKGGYLPVLVITAQSDHKLRALKAGAKDFVSKPFDLAEVLLRVRNMLEVRLLHQQALALYERVRSEQKVSERLLLSAVSPALAERLTAHVQTQANGSSEFIAESFAEVTVLFADILAFTAFAEGASAAALMGVLTDLSKRQAPQTHPAPDRRRTLSDAYLAAVGLTDAEAGHTIRSANKALDLAEALDRFNTHSRYQLKVRIGLHPGGAVSEGTSFDL
jgi:adenylate cyclase